LLLLCCDSLSGHVFVKYIGRGALEGDHNL
jgi:hypothetical protein